MVLAVEIDNSRINFGIFNEIGTLEVNFKIATDITKTSDEYAILLDGIFNYRKIERNNIDGAVLCSVVPTLTNVICDLLSQMFPVIKIIKVQKGIKTGFFINVDNPSELGSDLIANAAGVMAIQNDAPLRNQACIIVDIGTASTIFALNENKEFIGGSIIPGVEMSFNALHGKTAQLPIVTPIPPTRVIGKNSQESIRSGVILGTAIMIDGFVEKFAAEIKAKNFNVYVTGEYAQDVIPFCTCKYKHIQNLTLIGLYWIYKNNNN